MKSSAIARIRYRFYYVLGFAIFLLILLSCYHGNVVYNAEKADAYRRHLQALKDMFTNASQQLKADGQNESSPINISDLQEVEKKKHVLLLVIVSTAPSRLERRKAMRDTWWKKCFGKVACKFFTDGLGLTDTDKLKLSEEQRLNKDIEFQPLASGRLFGMRYLYHIMWATAKYTFTYLLRLDDDYFVCMERLMDELPHRPDKMLSWGSYHCTFKDLVYMDEAWALFSSDVIERFLAQHPGNMLCHAHADQQIAEWISTVYNNKHETLVHFDDHRLHHYPPARESKRFENLTRVCDSFIGVHGCSTEMMRNFWRNGNDLAKKITKVTDVSQTCHFPHVFNISTMGLPYKFPLRPCVENPKWAPNEGMWLGVWLGSEKKQNG